MAYTIDDWRENLKTQRAQFSDAAGKWTTPTACWFRFDYQEPLTLDQHKEYAKAFMVSVADSGDAVDFVLPDVCHGVAYDNQHYTAALLDGTTEQNRLFRTLSYQTFSEVHNWPSSLPVQLDHVAHGWMAQQNYGYTQGPEFILWPMLVAGIRLTRPDIKLAMKTLCETPKDLLLAGLRGNPIRRRYDPQGMGASTFYAVAMQEICEYANFDASWTPIRPYQGPRVLAWGFVHDVWRTSVAALDRLIEESQPTTPPVPITATDADNDAPWHFAPGTATYRAIKLEVSGTRWKLLKALVESPKALTEAEVIEAGWGHDAEVEPKTIQNTLSKLRKTLRKRLGLTENKDPIPVVDHGKNRAWTLADFLR